MGYEVALVERQRSTWSTESILGQRNKQWRWLSYKISPPNSPSSNESSLYAYLEFSEENSSYHKIMWGCVEPSPKYSVPYQIPEGDTIKTTIYDQEIPYGQMVKLSQTTHQIKMTCITASCLCYGEVCRVWIYMKDHTPGFITKDCIRVCCCIV